MSSSAAGGDDETAPSAPQIEVSPAPVLFADDLQVLTVDRSAQKGTPIGQIKIVNPGRKRLTWTMRHRYRYGGKSFCTSHLSFINIKTLYNHSQFRLGSTRPLARSAWSRTSATTRSTSTS